MTLLRKNMRLDDYDYSLPGAYFVTICVDCNIPLFGKVDGDTVRLNIIGNLVLTTLREIPDHYLGIELDAHIIMPDHLHAILLMNFGQPAKEGKDQTNSLPKLMQRYKSLSSRRYGDWRKANSQIRLPERLWQRGYYDRILRGEADLQEKREYIQTNPLRWTLKHKVD